MHRAFAKQALKNTFNIAAKIDEDSFPVYYVHADLKNPNWLDGAVIGAQRFFFDQGMGTQYADFREHKITTIGSPDPATRSTAAADCLKAARAAGLVTPDTDVRILEVPQVYMLSLWLRTNGTDVFVPFNRGRAGDPPAYKADPDFIETVRERAENAHKKRMELKAQGHNPDLMGG